MPSLVEKMFDTMPLQGVLGAAATIVGAAQPATIGQVKRFVRRVYHSPPTYTANPSASRAGTKANDAAIWGWRTTGEPSFVEEVSCRVRDMDFAKYLVLERVGFGYAPTHDAKNFRPKVLVVFNGKEYELPLSTEYHLVSFTTDGGYIKADKNAPLWPLESYHDESLLHVFVYDIDRVSGATLPLSSPQHPDKKQVDELRRRLNELNTAGEDDTRKARDVLFADDLWDPPPANTPPTATVPEDVDLSLKAVRVMVACSLTPCRERNDFAPGRAQGVGRLYPHVMVVATSALDRVEAGVRFKRPATSTMLDHGLGHEGHHHMMPADEVVPEIKSLLVTDSNAGGMVLFNPNDINLEKGHVVVGDTVPVPHWANLFNYYVVDPIKDSNVGDKLIPVVRRSKTGVRNKSGDVNRDCKDLMVPSATLPTATGNARRVLKRERQGYFDNIHIAPRMRVMDAIAEVRLVDPVAEITLAKGPPDKAAWNMDDVVMAPFCAHDCFHLHWRWADNANNDYETYGWGPAKPWSEVGRVMVPENQDVFLQLMGDAEFSYLAHAHDSPKDAWQPFCHHGAGYAVHVGEILEMARAKLSAETYLPGVDLARFYDATGHQIKPTSWALFYWRLRYRVVRSGKALAAEERFTFVNEHAALDL